MMEQNKIKKQSRRTMKKMNNTLLISEKLLKRDSLINDNVDPMYLLPAIRTAQDQGLQPIIGTSLFNKLKDLVSTGEIQTELEYKNLLDEFIVPYLEWKVMSDVQIPLAWKTRNAGVVTNVDEHFANNYNTYMDNVQYIKDYYEDKAVFYSNRLSDYLMANSELFPEYYDWKCGEMRANKDAYNTHIYLGESTYTPANGEIFIIHTNKH